MLRIPCLKAGSFLHSTDQLKLRHSLLKLPIKDDIIGMQNGHLQFFEDWDFGLKRFHVYKT